MLDLARLLLVKLQKSDSGYLDRFARMGRQKVEGHLYRQVRFDSLEPDTFEKIQQCYSFESLSLGLIKRREGTLMNSMLAKNKQIALQINMYPPDIHHVANILPHQLRMWSSQVNSIHLTVDCKKSQSGRYSNDYDHSTNIEKIRTFCYNISEELRNVIYDEVDYSVNYKKKVGRFFFDADGCPEKAWDGGPFYSYFFGVYNAQGDYVLHMDSDMLYGGGSKHWIQEAIRLFEESPNVLFMGPLPGPPRDDGQILDLRPQHGVVPIQFQYPVNRSAFAFDSVSTRIFLFNRRRFEAEKLKLNLVTPNLLQRLKATLLGNEPNVLEAETILSRFLNKRRYLRVDFLGTAPGMWSLHPPYRSEAFFDALPELIRRVEANDIPDSQRGRYDIVDELHDWTDVRDRYKRNARVKRQLLHAFRYWTSRIFREKAQEI